MASSSEGAEPSNAPDRQIPVYCSAPFKFIVDSQTFYVHADLISQCSKPLDRMIHGSMAEAQDGVATLEGIGQGTFLRFVEWLYKGYYRAAKPQRMDRGDKLRASSPPKQQIQDNGIVVVQQIQDDGTVVELPSPIYGTAASTAEDGWGAFGVSKSKKGKKPRKGWGLDDEYQEPVSNSAKESFVQRKYTMRNVSRDHPQPRPNKNKGEDYTEVFLCHVRLYVFADQYDIQNLKVLAMEELHAVLAVFTLYAERTGDVLSLLRYIYSETAEPDSGENLRTLAIQYVETEASTLIQDDKLGDLMETGPMLADFLKVMRRKLA